MLEIIKGVHGWQIAVTILSLAFLFSCRAFANSKELSRRKKRWIAIGAGIFLIVINFYTYAP